jgi:hypothetical protein
LPGNVWRRELQWGNGRSWLLIRLMSPFSPAYHQLIESSTICREIFAVFPGCKAILNTTCIEQCHTDSQLAELLSREIAHVLLDNRCDIQSQARLWYLIISMLFTLDWRMFVGQIGIVWGVHKFVSYGRAVHRRQIGWV